MYTRPAPGAGLPCGAAAQGCGALAHVGQAMAAPAIVAKGQNLIAQKIREVARESGVPIVENKPLGQALFKAAEIGQEIPEALYKAVAEVLAYVFRLQRRTVPDGPVSEPSSEW